MLRRLGIGADAPPLHSPPPPTRPALQANLTTGKSDEEAEQLRAEFGYNELEEKKVRVPRRPSARGPRCR